LEYGPLGSISYPIKISILEYFRYLHQSRERALDVIAYLGFVFPVGGREPQVLLDGQRAENVPPRFAAATRH